MDLEDFLTNVRLKFFLAKQTEGRSSGTNPGMNVPDRPAGILAALALMDNYASRLMTGEEIRSLFQGLSTSGLSNVVRSLHAKSLVEKDGLYYRITPEGIEFLVRFAEEALGSPAPVEKELRQSDAYRELMKSAEILVDQELNQKFEAAMRRRDAFRARLNPGITPGALDVQVA